MDKFFNALKKTPEYNPNLSWDTIIKSWEENFLGSNTHNDNFSNPLESDSSFTNYLDTNNKDSKLILPMLFDHNFDPKNADIFSCINKDCMELLNSNKINKTITDKNLWTIRRHCDCVSKPFFRLVLKPNLTESDIKKLLYLLADCEFTIEMGGTQMYKLPKLLFAYLVGEKLSNPIRLFNVSEFLESNSMEEIKNKICKFTDKGCWINQKYYVKNSTDIYIDIPLLVDFFSYNMSTALISLQYHDVTYKLNIPQNKVSMISSFVDDIVLMFEEIVYSNTDFRKKLAQNSMEFLKMNSAMAYFHCWKGNLLEISDRYFFASKFIFVVIRPHETTDLETEIINQVDKDIDISQLPQITGVELEEEYKIGESHTMKKKSHIGLENIWVAQFDNLVIYGIAADGISSMKNWIRVQSECIDSIEKMSFGDNTNGNIGGSNFNPNNYSSVFGIVNLTGIKIYLSESNIQTNIEVIVVNQNIQKIMSGMTGEAYSR
jgi:hypothetical protein